MAKAVFFNVLRDATGTPEIEIAPECKTVAQAIEWLLARFERLGEKLLADEGGRLRGGVAVLLDGKKIAPEEFERKQLGPKGELSFFEIIGGG
ncbi:MAG: MoaD/ThiS family protein [Planctomycetota bacterium]